MPMSVTCPACHRTIRVPDGFAGRGVCPDCRSAVPIPDDEPAGFDPPDDRYPRRSRRRPARRPTPLDHLPAWRRVATGFLVQQAAAVLLLIGLASVVAGVLVFAEDPGNFQAEPTTAQVVAASVGMLALFVGFAVQAVGRLVSASTPVRAPRALGMMSAVASVLAVLGSCVLGFFLVAVGLDQDQGNADEALTTVVGLCLFGWMFMVAAGETVHGLAVGAVGRVLRAGGARALGNGLGIGAAVAGVLTIFVFCGLSAWVGNNDPRNPDPNAEQGAALVAWLIGSSVLTALYLLLDVVLLHQARAAVARLAADADRVDFGDRWD